jgi:hypothetical protein
MEPLEVAHLEVAIRSPHFGIHLWPKVTLATLVKYGNVVCLAWRFQFRTVKSLCYCIFL